MRAQGGGTTPYGYRVETRRELVEVREEQAVLTLIAHLRRAGWTMPRIAAQLEELGFRTRAGLPFSKQGLSLILRREGDPAVAGDVPNDLERTG